MAEDRLLTDADVEAIAEKVLDMWEARFYTQVGKGVWGVIWKACVVVLVGLAGWGAATGGKLPWFSHTP